MTDPCWLPSAIMQTTGALLGIYAVVYVLMIDRFRKKIDEFLKELDEFLRDLDKFWKGREKDKNQKKMRALMEEAYINVYLDWGFQIIIILSFVTIILNAIWLDNLSVNVLNLRLPGILAVVCFFMDMVAILVFTLKTFKTSDTITMNKQINLWFKTLLTVKGDLVVKEDLIDKLMRDPKSLTEDEKEDFKNGILKAINRYKQGN